MSDVTQWEHDEQRAMEMEIESLRQQLAKFKSMSATEACSEIPAIGEYVAQVEKRLAHREAQIVGLRDAINAIWGSRHWKPNGMPMAIVLQLQQALAATDDMKEQWK